MPNSPPVPHLSTRPPKRAVSLFFNLSLCFPGSLNHTHHPTLQQKIPLDLAWACLGFLISMTDLPEKYLHTSVLTSPLRLSSTAHGVGHAFSANSSKLSASIQWTPESFMGHQCEYLYVQLCLCTGLDTVGVSMNNIYFEWKDFTINKTFWQNSFVPPSNPTAASLVKNNNNYEGKRSDCPRSQSSEAAEPGLSVFTETSHVSSFVNNMSAVWVPLTNSRYQINIWFALSCLESTEVN